VIIYEYVDSQGNGEITEWRKTLQKDQLAQLDVKIELILRVDDLDMLPGILVGTGQKNRKEKTPHIFKLQIGGRIRLRPMVCTGPSGGITLLLGAVERNWKLEPRNAPELAELRRKEIIANPGRRRIYAQPERTT